MKSRNLYFNHDCGYRLGMVHDMLDKGIIDFCLTDVHYHPGDEKMPEDSRIVCTEIRTGIEMTYEREIDVSSIPMPNKDVLEALLPYESMAIKMGSRSTNFQCSLYEEEKRNYFLHVRYWNYILDKYDINLCFFENTPHAQHTYIIYALAKIKKIPTIVLLHTTINGVYLYGDKIGNAGYNVYEYYNKLDCVGELNGEVEKYFNKLNCQTRDIYKVSVNRKKRQREVKKLYYGHEVGFSSGYYCKREFIVNWAKYVLKMESHEDYVRRKNNVLIWASNRRIVARFIKEKMENLNQYNKRAIIPNLSEKYIYFALQMTPEETTIPKGGVFAEQYTSIQLLAYAADKLGLKIYVKEHFLQPFREKWFYDMISEINNVELIKTDVNNYDLMKNSIAVATQTGSCIMEGIMMGKPAIVLGDGYAWKGMPGVFEVNSEEDGIRILNELIHGYNIDLDDVKKYFYAIQEVAYIQTYSSDYNLQDQKHMRETIDHSQVNKIYELIKDSYSTINENVK